MSEHAEVKAKAIRAVKWSIVATFLPQIIRPVVTVALARLLLPTDYGIVAMATSVVAMADMFKTMGLVQALIQSKDSVVDDASDVMFWSNILIATFLMLATCLFAPQLAEFFKEPRLIAVLRWQSLTLPISALSSVHAARLQRAFRFKALAGLTFLPTLAMGIVSIPLAALGYHYWSLVIGSLVSAAMTTAALWVYSGWRPHFAFHWHVAAPLFAFGAYELVEQLQMWVNTMGDKVVIGRYLSMADTGTYASAINIMTICTSVLVGPLGVISYPLLCRFSHDRDELRRLVIEARA
jgi:O-antigen/teichoic acid export membrane protein